MTRLSTDILVIGAGIAGLCAALEIPADIDVLVVTKDQVRESNSTYAQGGIAGVLAPEDRFENHIEDTLTAGGGLCDRAVVEQHQHGPPGRHPEQRRHARRRQLGAQHAGRRPQRLDGWIVGRDPA